MFPLVLIFSLGLSLKIRFIISLDIYVSPTTKANFQSLIDIFNKIVVKIILIIITIKGIKDIKSDRPEFIHRVFRQLVIDIKYGNDPVPKLKQALQKLNSRSVSPELLAISLVMCENPEEYEHIASKVGQVQNLVYIKATLLFIINRISNNQFMIQDKAASIASYF